MNSELSDVAKTQKAPTLKNVGAMSDNPIEQTCGSRRRDYGLGVASIFGENAISHNLIICNKAPQRAGVLWW